MSHYVGYLGKVIVREEFYSVIENHIDLAGTTDKIFMLYKKLSDEDRFDHGYGNNLIFEKWNFDKESGSLEFEVEHNISGPLAYPELNFIRYFIPYISKEIIEVYSFDECEHPPYKPITMYLQKQIENREETIREICKELNNNP